MAEEGKRGTSAPARPQQPLGYAKRLSPHGDKGRCGAKEKPHAAKTVGAKVRQLAEWVREAGCCVFHTGAGISTAAGIPDFRGADGVWTREKQGHGLPDYEPCWDNACPTFAHLAITRMVEAGLAQHCVSQNVDGLHLRAGLERERLSELHGNLFMEGCEGCGMEYMRAHSVDLGGVGFKPTGRRCDACGGVLRDKLLDWDDELPERDYEVAQDVAERCETETGGLAICLGTSMQMVPARDLPCQAKRLVIVNLQPTIRDRKAKLVIRATIDEVMAKLLGELEGRKPSLEHHVRAQLLIAVEVDGSGGLSVRMTGEDGLPLAILRCVEGLRLVREDCAKTSEDGACSDGGLTLEDQPFAGTLPRPRKPARCAGSAKRRKVEAAARELCFTLVFHRIPLGKGGCRSFVPAALPLRLALEVDPGGASGARRQRIVQLEVARIVYDGDTGDAMRDTGYVPAVQSLGEWV